MQEMRETGFMHNYMRMYWGKKIIEWTNSPEQAFARRSVAQQVLPRWPRSEFFAGVGWLFGLHDRPWRERPIFGTVRTMTAGGLDRKYDMDGYLARVAHLAGHERPQGAA